MLELDNLLIRQGDFTLRADARIAAGQIVALLGPSGAGKSTLLDAVAGFIAPAAGRILWDGRDITALDPAARPVSILFQDGNLFAHLDAWANVALGIRPSLKLSDEERARVAAALARVGLEGMGNRRPAQLSGGQAARVALARALIRGRPVMALDEPFSALGPGLKAEMLELVAGIARETGALVLMVSHDPQDARAIAGQVMLVAGGCAAAPVATDALFADPPPALRAYLGG